jgi:hypothetical protein
MDQAQGGRVCPYCAGKGYVLDEIENVPTERGEQTGIGAKTWTRKKCPWCGGRGRVVSAG